MTFSIHHGNCINWMATLADKSVDVTICDPPYSANVHANVRSVSSKGSKGVEIPFDAMTPDRMAGVAAEALRLTRRWTLFFTDFESIHLWKSAVLAAGLDYVRIGIWAKKRAAPQITGDRPGSWAEAIIIAHPKGRKRWNGGGCGNVWTSDTEHDRLRAHPTQKPVPLMIELVSLFSEPGETILDPYSGSGSTGVAALRLGRHFVGAEMDATYHAIAVERLSAEADGTTLQAARAGQATLFPLLPNRTS